MVARGCTGSSITRNCQKEEVASESLRYGEDGIAGLAAVFGRTPTT
jgi:hypothetical protein